MEIVEKILYQAGPRAVRCTRDIQSKYFQEITQFFEYDDAGLDFSKGPHVKNFVWLLSFQPPPEGRALMNILKKAFQHAPIDVLQTLFPRGYIYIPIEYEIPLWWNIDDFMELFNIRQWTPSELKDFLKCCAQKRSLYQTFFQLVYWIFFERRGDQTSQLVSANSEDREDIHVLHVILLQLAGSIYDLDTFGWIIRNCGTCQLDFGEPKEWYREFEDVIEMFLQEHFLERTDNFKFVMEMVKIFETRNLKFNPPMVFPKDHPEMERYLHVICGSRNCVLDVNNRRVKDARYNGQLIEKFCRENYPHVFI